jgi:hypothetical protein
MYLGVVVHLDDESLRMICIYVRRPGVDVQFAEAAPEGHVLLDAKFLFAEEDDFGFLQSRKTPSFTSILEIPTQAKSPLVQRPIGRTGEAIMSVPIRREEGSDSPLSSAPRRARQARPLAPEQFTAPVTTSTYVAPPRIASAPPMAPGVGGHNIDLPPPRSTSFEGDVAIKDLMRRLSLDPQLVPEPPIRRARKPVARGLVWLSFAAVVAAVIVFSAPPMTFLDEARNLAGGVAMPPREGSPRVGTLARPARLVVESQMGFANEPLPLGVSLNDASGGETVFLAGFAAGTEVSAGSPLGLTRWRVSAHDLDTAFAYSPRGFVGVTGRTATSCRLDCC